MDIQTLHAGNTLVLEPGTELNQYKILKVLGQGTFGITYLAVNLTLNQHVAIKEFLPEPVAYREHSNTVRPKSANDQLTFQHFKQRFLEEAQNLALFKHQNIVRINGYFEANETAYMVMDYETGISLEQQLAQGYRYSEAELTSFVRQLSSGLHRLHQVGIIHRDIKPDNIFIRAHDNSPVLLDFGSARHALHQKTQDMTTLLTVGYAPIEQYSTNGTRQGPWTDIYSLAAVCYELVTGNRPMESTIRSETKMRTGSDPLPLAAET
ncbi:MAG: serine/threonine protein kinase, partial [Methylococcales bacterium]|nr:serine/threonine protein kinase [Methylococcales bacterium]